MARTYGDFTIELGKIEMFYIFNFHIIVSGIQPCKEHEYLKPYLLMLSDKPGPLLYSIIAYLCIPAIQYLKSPTQQCTGPFLFTSADFTSAEKHKLLDITKYWLNSDIKNSLNDTLPYLEGVDTTITYSRDALLSLKAIVSQQIEHNKKTPDEQIYQSIFNKMNNRLSGKSCNDSIEQTIKDIAVEIGIIGASILVYGEFTQAYSKISKEKKEIFSNIITVCDLISLANKAWPYVKYGAQKAVKACDYIKDLCKDVWNALFQLFTPDKPNTGINTTQDLQEAQKIIKKTLYNNYKALCKKITYNETDAEPNSPEQIKANNEYNPKIFAQKCFYPSFITKEFMPIPSYIAKQAESFYLQDLHDLTPTCWSINNVGATTMQE